MNLSILYGGSVNETNIEELIKMLKAKGAELDNAKQITELEDWKFPVGAADERTSKHL